jgi:hypothetical protein
MIIFGSSSPEREEKGRLVERSCYTHFAFIGPMCQAIAASAIDVTIQIENWNLAYQPIS